ncbi:MAG: amino acid adenylation domain-containing protein [Polaribacter sp.]
MKKLQDILSFGVQNTPDKTAVSQTNQPAYSYAEVNELRLQLAATLEEAHRGKGHRIGLLAPKHAEVVASCLGILSVGAVYVPMDVEAPIVRNLHIIKDCQLDGMIIEVNSLKRYASTLEAFDYSIRFIPGFENLQLIILQQSAKFKPLIIEDLAFILYTSGSTGMPKGVMITHENALSFIQWAGAEFDVSADDVFASIAPFHFDLSIFDIYVSMQAGAELFLIESYVAKNPRMISTMIEERKISVVYATPTLLQLMLRYGKLEKFNHASLRYVLFAGEVFPIEPLKKIKNAWATAQFYNLYGPTETNVCTYYKIPETIVDQSRPFPIGRPCSFAKIKLVDPTSDNGTAINQGEIWVQGNSVSPGYWQQEEKTMEAFVMGEIGEMWYKTGDWATQDENGDYHFTGRKDRMVKRRGYRIELAEVEAALRQNPQLLSVAVAKKEEEGETKIIAFYEKAKETVFEIVDLKMHCMNYIPQYMLPDQFVEIEKMPYTSTQKIDYQKLVQL